MTALVSILSTLLAVKVAAFPQAVADGQQSEYGSLGQQAAAAIGQPSPKEVTFNAEEQLVDVTGIHEWRAPLPGQDRGPCPGLNALANHGYLPRSGRALVPQFIQATTEVYGMGIDLATILSVYGGVFNGAVLGWSIAGKEFTGIRDVTLCVYALLIKPLMLSSGSHNNYEGDSSPTRGDLNQHGTNEDLILSHFKSLLDLQPDPATANYDASVIADHRKNRYDSSVAGNPNFYYGPFTSFVAAAAHVLIPGQFSNHSDEFPNGRLDQETLKSFFAVSGPNDDLTWTKGHERIPDNWYRRARNDPFGFSQAGDSISIISERYPDTIPVGCNMGAVNTFTQINTTNTGLDSYDFSQPTESVCYALAQANKALSDLPLVGVVTLVLNLLITPITNALSCPTVPGVNDSVGEVCPGYSFRGGPTGPIAPGAINL